ncbi:heparinase II/III family protein [uncultured Mucilaginibacter sp.]|uniref:heparinase II/III domain-containing protein n=1 Tax=uncultured Mucilaginibacter sp. TaxID=797541 RepID=UPI0025DAC396|nr:heparinase II/III family protein [uncultured Mucilaginibacter sp.]
MKYITYRKISLALIAIILFALNVRAQTTIDTTKFGQHPRLLILKKDEAQIKALLKQDTLWLNVHKSIITECEDMLTAKVQERIVTGRRLLSVSREALRRIFFLSYAWRITNEDKYLKRAEEEMLAVSNFTDWNPSHFLDVAEMSLAVAIGYDWLYNGLSPKSRTIISEAIITKGLEPSLNSKYNSWLQATNNWNQVCNTGLSYGAIAIYERNSSLAKNILNRAVSTIQKPMKEYAPDGGYKEGYSYWGYGTSFNVFFISAMEKLFGTNFGLKSQPGFMNTGTFYEFLTGPSGIPFNYSDAGGIEGLQPAMFWFANQLKDPSLLFVEKTYLQTKKFNAKSNRILPAAIIWAGTTNISAAKPPVNKIWQGKGANQVAIMRTDWRRQKGIYAGFKGGSPSESHGHMDIGSFVADFEGNRWSADLGMEQYNSLESAGLSIWEMGQNSQRWDVFRYANFSHSTLTVNGHKQDVKGEAKIIKSSDKPKFMYAVMDITPAYKEDLQKAERGVAIVNNEYMLISDEVETGSKECMIRWAMLTPASVASIKGNELTLQQNGKQMHLKVEGIEGIELQTWSTAPPHSYDAANPGTALVGFETRVNANSKKAFKVYLIPAGIKITNNTPALLSNW